MFSSLGRALTPLPPHHSVAVAESLPWAGPGAGTCCLSFPSQTPRGGVERGHKREPST